MRARLWHRWFGLSVGLVGLTLGALLWMQQQHFQRGLLEHANALERSRLPEIAERLGADYRRLGSWTALAKHPRLWRQRVTGRNDDPGVRPPPFEQRRPPRRFLPGDGSRVGLRPGPPRQEPRPPGAPLEFIQRLGLLDAQRQPLIGPPAGANVTLQAITVDEAVVGYLTLAPLPALLGSADLDFAAKERRNALWLALPILAAAMLASLALSTVLLRRLKALARASQRLAAGDYATRLHDRGSDELGDLARDFDRLAESLQRGREARDRWIADISHELRTPLTVLRGELQALQDGIRPLDARALASLAAEGERLAQRVDDLYALALSDSGGLSYRYAEVDLVALISAEVEARRAAFASAGLTLQLDLPERAPLRRADVTRLQQLLANLLGNCLRYCAAGARVRLQLQAATGNAWGLAIDDSAPGVAAVELPHLLERHYRGSASRERAADGSGLGLAICQNIAQAHGGSIALAASALGGLQVRVLLPREGRVQ